MFDERYAHTATFTIEGVLVAGGGGSSGDSASVGLGNPG